MERLLLLPSALLALAFSHALAEPILARDSKSKTVPAPISISPSGQWDGIDGSWSSFALKVGTPAQTIDTFLSWNSYQIWGVLPEGCTNSEDYDSCAEDRGGIYNETASSSFHEKGLYGIDLLEDLGYYGNAVFGSDVVKLGNDGPTIKNTTVAGLALEDYYLGIFGINPQPTKYSSSDGVSSLMTLLKQQDYIPSISFGYTAGARYRSGDVSDAFASLTLGGYDTTKFVQNDVTWTFASDNFRDIVVAIQSINTPSQIESSPVPTELLPDAIDASLDATVPEIWLPYQACYLFEYEFGLVYDNTTELYLVNNTLHNQLLQRNASVTFQLAVGKDGGESVSIELPYAAFDLTAKSPFSGLSNQSYYFPLRRAANDSTITLGRTFFQEAYISVDYEAQKFNVSQRVWNDNADDHLVAIPPFSGKSTYPGTGSDSGSSGLSGGAIAGIVVGVIAALALVAILIVWLLRRRSKAAKERAAQNEKLGRSSDSETGSTLDASAATGNERQSNVIPKAELPASMPGEHDSDGSDLLGNVLGAGALSSSNGSTSAGMRTPRTPNALSGSTYGTYRWNSRSDSAAADSPIDGVGTYASSTSEATSRDTGTGTGFSLVSPLTPADSNDSKQRNVYEMAGDMPAVKEKDGKELSEKEALAHREKVFNGVDSAPSSPMEPTMSREPPRRVEPSDVVKTDTLLKPEQGTRQHRAFSFEEDRPQVI